MEILNDTQIYEIIKEYIEESGYNYAIMINGDWGCGKTYFVNECLLPKIKKDEFVIEGSIKKYKCVFMSLYGLNNLKELSKQIYIEIANEDLKESELPDSVSESEKKIIPLIETGKKILADLFAPSLNDVSIRELYGKMKNLDEYIFIFDDLERCMLPMNDILGYINNFVEKNSLKVIIIANENEIGTLDFNKHLELKYLVANNKNIEIDKNDKKEKYSEKLNLVELKDKTSKIFAENYEYKKIKEKLIGKTIYYQKQITVILKELVKKLNSSIFDVITIKNICLIIEEEFNECNNIRTLQFSLLNINKIVPIIIDNIIKKDDIYDIHFEKARENLITEVIVDIARISIHAKNGGKMPEKFCGENYEEDYGFSNLIDDKNIWFIGESKMSFRFNHLLIYNNHFDLDYIKKYANLRYDYLLQEELKGDDPFFKINNYWEMNQEEVEKLYKELIKKFFEGYYKASMFVGILRIVFTLQALGFEFKDSEEIIEKMKYMICEEDEENIMDNSFTPEIIDEELKKEFFKSVDVLKEEAIKNKNKNIIDEFKIIIMDPEKWSSGLHEFFSKYGDKYYEIGGILSLASQVNYKENILNSTVKQFSDFRRVITSAYNSGLISKEKIHDELKALESLKETLESSRKIVKDKIKVYNIDMFIEMIKKVIESLKK